MGNAERAPGEGTAGVTLVGGSEVGGAKAGSPEPMSSDRIAPKPLSSLTT